MKIKAEAIQPVKLCRKQFVEELQPCNQILKPVPSSKQFSNFAFKNESSPSCELTGINTKIFQPKLLVWKVFPPTNQNKDIKQIRKFDLLYSHELIFIFQQLNTKSKK